MTNVQNLLQCKNCSIEFYPKNKKQLHCSNWCARTYASRQKTIRKTGHPEVLPSIEGEKWQSVKDYEGLYEVSSLGRIKCLHKDKNYHERELYQGVNSNGYKQVCLMKKNKKRTFSVHRLVAIAFLESNEHLHINHIDCNRTNNALENLEWCDRSHNMKHAYHVGSADKVGTKNGRAILNWDKVQTIKEMIANGNSIKSIAELYNVTSTCISYIKLGKSWNKCPKY